MAGEDLRDELNFAAMQIILHAGDAKMKIESALDEVNNLRFEKAFSLLDDAEKDILEAHQSQTKIIQDEAGGKEYPNSLLFNHAQDTMMIAMNDLAMAKKMIRIFESVAVRTGIITKE